MHLHACWEQFLSSVALTWIHTGDFTPPSPFSSLSPLPSVYKPCDPVLVKEKESQLGQAYEELGLLAGARRARLEESRRLWQFLWELGEEAAWIREQEQILAAGDCGRDLSSALHLLSKHEAFRDEMAARYGPLGHSIAAGEQLVSEGHFGAPEVTERIADVRAQWAHLEEVRTWGEGYRGIERRD